MTARQIDDAARRLRELHVQSIEDLGLAAGVFVLALTATQVRPAFALPLLIGAMVVTFLGLRALVRRRFLVEDLAVERDAYAIEDVRRYGLRVASLEHRRLLAGMLRGIVEGSTAEIGARVDALRPELEELVCALEDERRTLEPDTAVRFERRLYSSPSPLHDPCLSVEELRARLRSLLASIER